MAQKTVCITGCSEGGIGYALAKEFHARGLYVFATSRTMESMKTLKELGIETLVLDVTESKSIKDLKAIISESTGGKLDILVNNAGIVYPYAVSDADMDRVRALFNVNVFGAMEMVHEFIPLLLKSGDARIVQTGSVAAVIPVPFDAAYNASKAALHSFGDTLRVELAPFNVKVINVAAGRVKSNIIKPETMPPDSIYSPIREEYQKARIDNVQGGIASAESYARIVVSEALKSSPKAWLWAGSSAWLCWLMSTFGSRRSLDSLLSGIYGLTKLAGLIAKEKAV